MSESDKKLEELRETIKKEATKEVIEEFSEWGYDPFDRFKGDRKAFSQMILNFLFYAIKQGDIVFMSYGENVINVGMDGNIDYIFFEPSEINERGFSLDISESLKKENK